MPSLSLNTHQQFVGNFGRDTDVTPLDVGAGLSGSLSPEIRDLLNFDAILVMPGVDASLRQQLSSESLVTPENVVRFGQKFVKEFLASALKESERPVHSRIDEARVIIAEMEASKLWEAMLNQTVGDSPAVVPATGELSDYEESMTKSLGLAA